MTTHMLAFYIDYSGGVPGRGIGNIFLRTVTYQGFGVDINFQIIGMVKFEQKTTKDKDQETAALPVSWLVNFLFCLLNPFAIQRKMIF
jgi:hypothetical protein